MGIIEATKKGLEASAKSLLLCLVVLIILFVGYIIIGSLLGVTMLGTKFPAITPDMTPQQLNALPWSQVNWAVFIPSVLIIFILGFMLNAFTQSGIVATLKDCITEGREKIASFFGYAVKYCLRLFLQIILVVLITAISVIIALLIMTLVGLTKVNLIVVPVSIIIFLALLASLIYIAMVLVYGQISLVFKNSKAVEALGEAIKFINKNLSKTVLLFVLTGIIYVAFYLVIRQLTVLTFRWPVISQVIWNLVTSYIYLLVSIFMLGSFIAFYSAAAQK